MDQEQRSVWSWALYDWANSAFATVVIAGFFPIFFKEYWSVGVSATENTFRLGVANSIASLSMLLIAPMLGAIADQGTYKKRFLTGFAILGIFFTAAMYSVEQGQWQLATLFYVMASLGFAGANVFYDSFIVDVSSPRRYEWVSSLGFSLGYLGGGLVFSLCVLITLKPHWFGLDSTQQAVKLSFLITAAWWMLFTLPLLKNVQQKSSVRLSSFFEATRLGWKQLKQTLIHIRQYRVVFWFLVAYWFYIDAVDTIIRMAVDYGLALGFTSTDLITALLLVQFIGFPAALGFGWLGQRIGPKLGIMIGLAGYVGITVWAYFIQHIWEFYALAIAIGLIQGGVQALSRSLYARLIPADYAAEFFGFYNLLGKFAAVLGPIMMGWVALMSGSTRGSILVLLVLFGLGALILSRVKVESVKHQPT